MPSRRVRHQPSIAAPLPLHARFGIYHLLFDLVAAVGHRLDDGFASSQDRQEVVHYSEAPLFDIGS